MDGQKNEPDINELKAYKPLFPLSPFFKDRQRLCFVFRVKSPPHSPGFIDILLNPPPIGAPSKVRYIPALDALNRRYTFRGSGGRGFN